MRGCCRGSEAGRLRPRGCGAARDERLTSMAMRKLRLWLVQSNRTFSLPQAERRAELLEFLKRAGAHLPAVLAAECEFAIRTG